MIISRGNPKKFGEKLLQSHFFRHEPHMKSRGIELEAPW
jgi:hypothetical protein